MAKNRERKSSVAKRMSHKRGRDSWIVPSYESRPRFDRSTSSSIAWCILR